MTNKLIWITGLSGAGKTTVAKVLLAKIKSKNPATAFIDGDAVREINGDDLGHNLADRIKNAYRIVKLCRYLCAQDLNVVCATMSLYDEIHRYIYSNFQNPLIVYLDVPMEELKKRNQKMLYSAGTNVSGVDLPYKEPEHNEFVLKINNTENIERTVNKIIERLEYDTIS